MQKFLMLNAVRNNRKVMTLDAETFRFWVLLLAVANDADDRGSLPSDEDVDFELRINDLAKTTRLVQVLVDRGLIDVDDEGVRRMHDWGDYQVAGNTDAERARKYREKKRAKGAMTSTSPATAPIAAPTAGSAASPGMEPGPRGPARLGSSDPSPPRTATPSTSPPTREDDEPFAAPVPVANEDEALPLYEPIGANSAAQVAATRAVAFELYGGTNVPGLVDVWLRTHTADAVQHALRSAVGKQAPSRYIEAVLRNHATAPAALAMTVEEKHRHRMATDPEYRARHEAKLRLDDEAIAKKQAALDAIEASKERMRKLKEDHARRQEELYASVDASRLAKAG